MDFFGVPAGSPFPPHPLFPPQPLPPPASSKKPPAPPAAPATPVSVELALPKLPKLPKPLLAPSEPPRPRLTVREAAAARTPLPEPPKAPGEPLARIPAVELAPPKGSLGLSPPQIHPGKGGPTRGDEEGAARGGFPTLRVPSVPIDVPKASVELGLAGPEPPAPRPASSREPEAPPVEIAPKIPKFRLPRLGWALGKLSASPPPEPPGLGTKLKVPKLSLAPFGDTEEGARFGPGSPRSPRFGIGTAALPKFGGSSPDLRSGGIPKTPPKRGGSAESLILTWGAPQHPGPKARGGSVPPWSPRIPIPAVGFALPGERPKIPEAPGLKVPLLELAPPGLDASSDPSGRRFGVKLPKFGAASSGRMRRGSSKGAPEESEAPRDGNPRRRRWVPRVGFAPPPEPPKLGRIRFPEVELCPGDPQIPGTGGIPSRCQQGEGTPKFQLPQLVLSPQICGEP